MKRKSILDGFCFLLTLIASAPVCVSEVRSDLSSFSHKNSTEQQRELQRAKLQKELQTAATGNDLALQQPSSPPLQLYLLRGEQSTRSKTNKRCVPEKYCVNGKKCQLPPDGGGGGGGGEERNDTASLPAAGRRGCSCPRKCSRRYRPVCANNGKIYANRCELHRAACDAPVQLTASKLTRCLHRERIAKNHGHRLPNHSRGGRRGKSRSRMHSSHEKHNLANDVNVGPDLYWNTMDCTSQEYEIMKDNLLVYNHARLLSMDNHSKEYLISVMFSHYDRNNNGKLERAELEQISERENLNRLSRGCTLGHMMVYDDSDGDGRLNVNEFYTAFSKLYSVSVVSLDKSLEVNHISARVGDNVEIKCDVTGTPIPPLTWWRNGVDLETLAEQETRILKDSSLYLTEVQLMHAGNYTCRAKRNQDIVQTHVLTVHTVPEVRVTPQQEIKEPGEEAVLRCHAVGEPYPRIDWLRNNRLLTNDRPDKYEIIGNGTKLIVRNVNHSDRGQYICQANSVGGIANAVSTLTVWERTETAKTTNEEHKFFSFHEWGILIHGASICHVYHEIRSTDRIAGTEEYVCGEKDVPCSWGRSINVADRYIYASQPEKDRILVISIRDMMVSDVITTDKYPVDLWYVQFLDQVWILNWQSERNEGIKTVQVVRDAGKKKKHRTIHPEPIDGQFDRVKGLYISEQQELGHTFKYGYVTHANQSKIVKLDLKNLKYTHSGDLGPYNCVPAHVQFSALYGFVIVECKEPDTEEATGQLLLDYLTDAVLAYKPNLLGKPTISPDSRHLLTLHKQDDGVTLVVQEISPSGLKFAFDVKTTLNISDIAFYPSQTSHGYDIYASSSDKEDILFLNLVTGKVEMITGVGKAMPSDLSKWGNPNRPIVTNGIFGRYMVSPSNEALYILNGETRMVNCEIGGVVHIRTIV